MCVKESNSNEIIILTKKVKKTTKQAIVREKVRIRKKLLADQISELKGIWLTNLSVLCESQERRGALQESEEVPEGACVVGRTSKVNE